MLQKKITFDSFIRGILTAVVIIGILYLVNQLSGVLLPFFVAWLIAYLIYTKGLSVLTDKILEVTLL